MKKLLLCILPIIGQLLFPIAANSQASSFFSQTGSVYKKDGDVFLVTPYGKTYYGKTVKLYYRVDKAPIKQLVSSDFCGFIGVKLKPNYPSFFKPGLTGYNHVVYPTEIPSSVKLNGNTINLQNIASANIPTWKCANGIKTGSYPTSSNPIYISSDETLYIDAKLASKNFLVEFLGSEISTTTPNNCKFAIIKSSKLAENSTIKILYNLTSYSAPNLIEAPIGAPLCINKKFYKPLNW